MKPWMAAWFCVLACLVPARGMAQGQPVWGEVDVVSSWQGVAVTAPVIFRTDSRLPNPQLAATGVIVDVRLRWRMTVSGGYLGGYLATGSPRTSSLVGVPLVAALRLLPFGALSRRTVMCLMTSGVSVRQPHATETGFHSISRRTTSESGTFWRQ